ncbi:hypothetical protein D7294_27400 [Streptomyces hoynatensis]|uniref:Uncharacterized protein n=1 Tax=Streptomyces hoynatensis TaxID=1141874 RepID=A0A3A9YMY9_9ACTN|nr:hypothetical protein D7294_27400 [Streptomyces hoynatensis]
MAAGEAAGRAGPGGIRPPVRGGPVRPARPAVARRYDGGMSLSPLAAPVPPAVASAFLPGIPAALRPETASGTSPSGRGWWRST